MESSERRIEIDGLIASGEGGSAALRLAELWRREMSPAAAAFVVSTYESLRGRVPLLPYRLAILRSFTVEPLVPMLRAACFCAGIDLAVHVGGFNAQAQEILDPDGGLYRFGADAVILAVQTRDIAPDLWQGFADLTAEERAAAARRVAEEFGGIARAFRERSRAHLIVHALEEPYLPSQGILDVQAEGGQAESIRGVNEELRRTAAAHGGVYVLDYDALVARHGRDRWHDERKWLAARMPLASVSMSHMIAEWMRFLHPLTGKIAKALAVDLDNTLWGGVIGEDGMAGIRLGAEHPGAHYQAVQRALLDLRSRGILLCVCSKNNPAEALEALERHPGMLLNPRHFAALRVNWNDKARSLRELAEELNVGLDSLAFLDDNPAERESVRAQLPEVTVVELPDDAARFAQALRDCPVFERLGLSAEDRERGAYYAAQRERADFEHAFSSREDFYRRLRQEVEIAPATPATLGRVAQLTQKTNQFNLTTRRYTEQQLAELCARPDWQVLGMSVRDRFGDSGLVGVAVVRHGGEASEVDAFLLSCRVIGRTVETALLARVVNESRARGALRLRGWFLPTAKNAPAKDFYADHGFSQVDEDERGSLWSLDVARAGVNVPDWIGVVAAGGEGS
ncbi:MAG TPA: HAD-IIIC family phosphatase [Pyrinomonadaceae bacterium]|jgi:FkbH-like protein|nr:HAD-IIIC family phosphatase [Pyrinomonadaceae bacterium]